MTIAQIIALFSSPLAKAIEEMVAVGRRNPDVAPAADEVARLLGAATADVPARVMEALGELRTLVNTGSGPVTHDPVDLS